MANELETLQAEFISASQNKNYQHKGMPDDEFNTLSLLAFDHYTTKQQHDAMLSWVIFNGGSRKGGLPAPGSCEYEHLRLTVARYRFMAQTNLFFLARMLGYTKVTDYQYNWYNPQTKGWEWHNTHEEICNDFFVRKDPAHFATLSSSRTTRLPRSCTSRDCFSCRVAGSNRPSTWPIVYSGFCVSLK